LKAFQELLAHLPGKPGLALVLIPHLDPSHESLMPEILGKSSKMPVREAHEHTPLEVDHVYVIKPNTSITLAGGTLETATALSSRSGGRDCIDHFFLSLAHEQRERAIGVILSGTASDGAAGTKAIKGEGGITFAQDHSAEFAGMPTAAVATGAVDYILPPQGIAEELVRIAGHPYVASPGISQEDSEIPEKEGSPFREILHLLEEHSGVPFQSYKSQTLERRVARRMALRKSESLGDYLAYLRKNTAEIRLLHDELLINVTSFFREPATFDALKIVAYPALLENRKEKAPIRIWVPGCSTGEEAYSLAISLVEFLDQKGSSTGIQIFASDVSEPAIAKARLGVYPNTIAGDVSPDRLRRFFLATDNGKLQISKRIRDLVLFARQDMTQDPPFSRLDILSCRNVLIYLGPALHRRVMPLFHYALRPGGFLVLGASESADRFGGLFHPVDGKHRIYSKIAGPSYQHLGLQAEKHRPSPGGAEREPERVRPEPDLARGADRILMGHYAPAGIVVSESGEVVEVRGDVSRFLRVSPGKPNWHLQRMAREELLAEFETALREAREKNAPVRRENLVHRVEGQLQKVSVNVLPIEDSGAGERYFVMAFEDAQTAQKPASAPAAGPGPDAARTSDSLEDLNREIGRLRQALGTQQDYQQTIVEKLESANEELRSSHEEVMSANEELQSTNEELQTAKEELQSSNEELMTLNDELRSRNAELGQTNDDLQNVLSSVQIPMVIVDTLLRIRRITPLAERLLSVVSSDPNRRITDFQPQVEIPNLETLLRTSIDNLSVIEQEVRDREGKWWLLRIRPYRTQENKIDGAVLTMLDVDELKRSAIRTEERRVFSEALVESMRDPFLVLDGHFHVKQLNDAFLRFFQVKREDVEGKLFFGISGGRWEIPALRNLMQEILPKNTLFKDFQVEREFPEVGPKVLLLHARQVRVTRADEPMILLTFEDATLRRESERRIRDVNQNLERQVSERTSKLEGAKGELEAFTYSVAHDLRAPLRAMSGFGETLLEEYLDKPLGDAGREYVERILAASRRMDTLILDLLSFSRLSREEIRLEPVELDSTVKMVVDDLAGELQARKAVLVVSPALPRVLAHPATLVQVLTNLLTNALKFVAHGTVPRILIRADTLDQTVRLWVEDNGVGVAEHHMERIFRVFERLNKAEEYPGTGIGLAIVRKSMERMNGQVGIESRVGQGSKFWIELLKDRP